MIEWTKPEFYHGIGYYYAEHPGPCILWLHGYTMNATIWEEAIDRLPGYAHLAIDIPGHGLSGPISLYKSLPELAKAIIELADIFRVRFIVALSFGGLIGIQMAIGAPDRYDGLFLHSSPFGGGPADPDAETKNLELMRLFQSGASRERLCDAWMKSPPDIFTGAARYPALLEQLRGVILLHGWRELENNGFLWLTGHRQSLESIRVPVHLSIGEMDMENIKRSAEVIKRRVKEATRVYIPNCGHLSILEDPATCMDVMKRYLNL